MRLSGFGGLIEDLPGLGLYGHIVRFNLESAVAGHFPDALVSPPELSLPELRFAAVNYASGGAMTTILYNWLYAAGGGAYPIRGTNRTVTIVEIVYGAGSGITPAMVRDYIQGYYQPRVVGTGTTADDNVGTVEATEETVFNPRPREPGNVVIVDRPDHNLFEQGDPTGSGGGPVDNGGGDDVIDPTLEEEEDNTILYLGLGAAALYFLTRKKEA